MTTVRNPRPAAAALVLLLAVALPLASAGIYYSSYTNLWSKWKQHCGKTYTGATVSTSSSVRGSVLVGASARLPRWRCNLAQNTQRFNIFVTNCKKAGLKSSGACAAMATRRAVSPGGAGGGVAVPLLRVDALVVAQAR